MIKNIFFTKILAILFFVASQACCTDIAKDRLKLFPDREEYIPFICNYPLNVKNEKIKHVIISIHASKHNVYNAFYDVNSLMDKYDLTDSVLIIAPQFLMANHVKDINSAGLVYWNVSPFWGSGLAEVLPEKRPLRISAYSIIENIIASLSTKKEFPNIESITIIGHSAGGQFVNRYSVSNTVEGTYLIPAGIKMKYIVMNPSSYVYLSPKRPVEGTVKQFVQPADVNIGYNDYGYGLRNLYAYHRQKRLTADKIRQQFQRRKVIYMLGNNDTQPGAMSATSMSMLQGKNRFKRGLSYYGHLIDEFGQQIKENQKLVIIPNVGHSGRDMILSSRGALNIIGDWVTDHNNFAMQSSSDSPSNKKLPEDNEED